MPGETPNTITVLIVEDHDIFRQGLRVALKGDKSLVVVGEAETAQEAERLAAELKPRVVLMDVRLAGGEDGSIATRRIKSKRPDTHVIALSVCSDRGTVRRMFEAGVSGFVTKGTSSAQLLAAIRAAVSGEIVASRPANVAAIGDYVQSIRRELNRTEGVYVTEQERRVLLLLMEGYSLKEVAGFMRLSPSSVKEYVRRMKRRFGARTRSQLLRRTREACILAAEDLLPSARSPIGDETADQPDISNE